ncbi:MAG: hypothetical protein V4480_04880 [Patescibacteria group bacterium]
MNIGEHHLHLRKRTYRRLEAYPHPDRLRRMFDMLMYAVGIVSPLALLPQAMEVYVHRDVAGLSLVTWGLLGCASLLWTLYGVLHREYPILVTNAGMTLLNFGIVIGILLFR